jgi:hypothetical protein
VKAFGKLFAYGMKFGHYRVSADGGGGHCNVSINSTGVTNLGK